MERSVGGALWTAACSQGEQPQETRRGRRGRACWTKLRSQAAAGGGQWPIGAGGHDVGGYFYLKTQMCEVGAHQRTDLFFWPPLSALLALGLSVQLATLYALLALGLSVQLAILYMRSWLSTSAKSEVAREAYIVPPSLK